MRFLIVRRFSEIDAPEPEPTPRLPETTTAASVGLGTETMLGAVPHSRKMSGCRGGVRKSRTRKRGR